MSNSRNVAGGGTPNPLGLNVLHLLPLLNNQSLGNQLTLSLDDTGSATSRSGTASSSVVTTRGTATYRYTVKIFNPASSGAEFTKFIVRQLHNFKEKFANIAAIKTKIVTSFSVDVQSVNEISTLGYFEGKQKRWLCDNNDLEVMYKVFTSSNCEIPLWCERLTEKEPASSSNIKHAPTKRERHEEEVSDIFEDLKVKHKEMELPKLRLWARMIANGIHDSTEEPPNVPMFTAPISKHAKHESLHDAVVDAAKVVAQAFTGSPATSQHVQSTAQQTVTTSTSLAVSPARLADVRMKHYEQLRYLHKLFDDGILNEQEFLEQKRKILGVLKSL